MDTVMQDADLKKQVKLTNKLNENKLGQKYLVVNNTGDGYALSMMDKNNDAYLGHIASGSYKKVNSAIDIVARMLSVI